MEYEMTLDGPPGEVFAIDADVTAPLAPGAAISIRIAPGGAVVVPA